MPVWLKRTEFPAVMRAESDGGELHGFTWKSVRKDPVKGKFMLQRKRVQQSGGEEQMKEPCANRCMASQVTDDDEDP